jgi:FkbM family methyltransferase
MLTNAPEAEFLAFEPIPKFHQTLKHRFPGSNVHVFNIALSDYAGEASFNFVTTSPVIVASNDENTLRRTKL